MKRKDYSRICCSQTKNIFLTDDDKNVKKAKGTTTTTAPPTKTNEKTNKQTKKLLIKRIPKFNDYKNCLFKNEIILKSQQRFKSEGHCIYTEEVNKIALSSNDDERLQIFDRIRTYPYGLNVFKVCKMEMLSKYK